MRLVYAPSAGVGFFGGDDMNFDFPRFTGDFAVLRAYVGPDGKPAPYSKYNVPYRPDEHLKVSVSGLYEGSPVFVAGFPGRTERLEPYPQIKYTVEHRLPWRIAMLQELVDKLDEMGRSSEELRVKGLDTRQGLMNSVQGFSFTLDAANKSGILEIKEREEAKLREWINADPARQAAFGDILPRVYQHVARITSNYEADALMMLTTSFPDILSSALAIARFAEEREKPDADRDSGYQDRDLEIAEKSERTHAVSYDRRIAIEMLTLLIEKSLAAKKKDKGLELPWLSAFWPRTSLGISGDGLASFLNIPAQTTKRKSVRDQVTEYFSSTSLEDLETRVALFRNASVRSLKRSQDPMIQLALRLRPFLKEKEDRDRGNMGDEVFILPAYNRALRELQQGRLAPDANGTLRLTFGRLLAPPEGSELNVATTDVAGMLKLAEEKRRKAPYDAPQFLINEAAANAAFGQQTVNFLADVDITGGNSGSALMNKHGEFEGLVFDGTRFSMQEAYRFDSNVRNIAVDVRYALDMMKLNGAGRILDELTIVGQRISTVANSECAKRLAEAGQTK